MQKATTPTESSPKAGLKTGEIICQGITKEFRLRDDLAGAGQQTENGEAQPLGGRLSALTGLLPGFNARRRIFTALQGIDLTIESGQAVAFLGANGSGKSTLLKVIAGVMKPTSGTLEVGGRVAALLELGAGLHDDLSGYENIFLAGRVYGFTDAEIRERLPRIVDFTGLGRFLEAPVRTYSSGMFARLAFTIATEVDPEIILIDEILSVGDADFQTRSFQRIREFSQQGKTMVIVSHNPEAVEQLSSRAVWLKNGRIIDDGPTQEVMKSYHSQVGRFIVGMAGFSAAEMLPDESIRNQANAPIQIGEIEYIQQAGEDFRDILRFRAPITLATPAPPTSTDELDAAPDIGQATLHLVLSSSGGISLIEVEAPTPVGELLKTAENGEPSTPLSVTIEIESPNLLASDVEVQLVARLDGKTIASAPHPYHFKHQNLALPIPEVLTHLEANWLLHD